MRHFDRKISDSFRPTAWVWYVPYRPRDLVWPRGRASWKPFVECGGASYLGAVGENVYESHPTNPNMPPFYFAHGVPEH